MDLLTPLDQLPTAAELRVKRLRAQLDELSARGERWTEQGRKASRALDLALVEKTREGQS